MSLLLCVMLLRGESDVPVGSDSGSVSVTPISSPCEEVVGDSEATEKLPSPEPKLSCK